MTATLGEAGAIACPPFLFDDSVHQRLAPAVLRRLPAMSGQPVRIQKASGLRDRHGPVHGAAFLRRRSIRLDCTRAEFPRILVHELFHFVWFRAGNPPRHAFEGLLREEWRAGATGELGWSAEWRKDRLTPRDVRTRTRRWREYCCESFCDSAAWLYSGLDRHPEFNLPRHFRQERAAWFRKTLETEQLSI
jgi:hypothetical protein